MHQWRPNACIKRIDGATFAVEEKLLVKGYLRRTSAKGGGKGCMFKLVWTLLTLRKNTK